MQHQQNPPAIVPVDPKRGDDRVEVPTTRRTFMPRIKFGRRTFGRYKTSASRRTFGNRRPSRRTFGFSRPSRRTFGGKFPSRRTFGGRFPSRRTFGFRGI
ncbi:MAG: hypothetical protein ACKO2C_09295 [Actinomycetes bacterium]